MKAFVWLRSVASAIFSRSRFENDMDEELRAHIQDRANDLQRSGLSLTEAERLARLEFGGYQKFKEECREALGAHLAETLLQDIRYGLRMLRKSPGFAIIAVLTLAFGIGANTAIFSIVDAVLLRPLPYHVPERLVVIGEVAPGSRGISVAYPNYLDWKAQNKCFDNMAAYNSTGVILHTADGSDRLDGWMVSASFLRTLGVTVALGRDFSDEDERTAAPVLLLTDGLWKRHFDGDPAVINSPVTLDGKRYTVIGVLPPSFRGYFTYGPPEILVPFAVQIAADKDWLNRTSHAGTMAIARLKPGVSLAEASSEMRVIAARLAKQYPDTNSGNSVSVWPMLDEIAGDIRPALLILLAGVGAVLLIACTNVASLQLARGMARNGEIAVRIALGARRSRVMRQLLTESFLLSMLGGTLGVVLAIWCVHAVVKAKPSDLPRLDMIAVNPRVLAFTAGLSLLTGILFGLLPAWRISSGRAHQALQVAGRSAGLTPSSRRVGNSLIVTEMALPLLLLMCTGLLIRSFARLRAVDAGFNPQGVLTFRIFPPEERYPDSESRLRFYEGAIQKLRTLPGVEAIGAVTPLPFSGSGWQNDYRIEGQPLPQNNEYPSTEAHYVTPDYFRVMQVPLLRGRLFSESDRKRALPVVVINETAAQRMWPNQDPLGKRIRAGSPVDLVSPDWEKTPWWTVVGIVRDVHQYSLDRATKVDVYFPLYQHPVYVQTFVVRASVPPLALADSVRGAIAQLDPTAPVFRIAAMEQYVSASLDSRRLVLALMGGFGSLAVLLAAVGIYGVISYGIARRTHEIGVRMALGARRADILRMILSQTARLVAAGVTLGLLAAVFATAFLRTQLFGITPRDPATFLGVAVLLVLLALVATYVPTRRAMRVDPMVALRYEQL